jgi:hypothetical protein
MCDEYDVKEVKVPAAYFITQGVSPRRDVDYCWQLVSGRHLGQTGTTPPTRQVRHNDTDSLSHYTQVLLERQHIEAGGIHHRSRCNIDASEARYCG